MHRLPDDVSHHSENHEAPMLIGGPHPSRRAQERAPQDEEIKRTPRRQDQQPR